MQGPLQHRTSDFPRQNERTKGFKALLGFWGFGGLGFMVAYIYIYI